MTPAAKAETPRFINREISWLAFNSRVLEEAADQTVPLLERVKFAAIAASNLDEFFMVRVAGLQQAVADENVSKDPSGLTPAQQLAAIAAGAHAMVDALYKLVNEQLLVQLAAHRIRLVTIESLDAGRQASLTAFFTDSVLPVLTPLAIDPAREFPLLVSLSLNLVVLLEPAAGTTDRRIAVVPMPGGLPRLVRIADDDGVSFVLLEDVVRAHVAQLFPGQAVVEATSARLTRDSELELDDEGGRTQLEVVERELRQRRRSDVVRLEIGARASDDLVALLRDRLDLTDDDVFRVPGPIDVRTLAQLADLPHFDALHDPPLEPVSVLAADEADLFSLLDERDLLLHHPYDAYDPVLALLAHAADDPDVLAIKQTLYRTSAGSPLIGSLRRAAERGKQVTVVIELTARFDEERNIRWARMLEEAGAHVIYGVRGYKIHAKICLIVRRTPQGLRRYVHLGTGNYNDRTARMYTDFGLMTGAPAFGEDATAFFNALTGFSDPPRLKKLVMAPTGLRRRLLRLIDRERRRAESGQPAEIVAKMNSLLDPEIIEGLYAASKAGVRIQLNVRGICALRPGVRDLSDHIEVVSIIDRFLEHSRIFFFLNGGEEEVFLSSADWMTRNLDKRVELMFPVDDSGLKARVLASLRAMFRENVKARRLTPDGTYTRRRPPKGDASFRVQQYLQEESRRLASIARDRVGISFRAQQAGTADT